MVKYVGHTLAKSLDFLHVIPNFFMWAFIVLAVADYTYRLWLFNKERKKRKNKE